MANRLQPKQLEDYKIGRMGIATFAAAGINDVVTTALTTAAASDNVPVQVSTSATTKGFKATGVNNKVLIVDSVSKQAIDDGLGNEVYGRLTEATGVYTLTYYSLVAGVETSVALASQNIDFWVNYNYLFKDLPNDILIRVNSTMVGEDPDNQAGRPISEKVTITALNTVANLTKTPIANSVKYYINGKAETEGASEAFTRVGKVLSYSPTNAGYDLETTDDLLVCYSTFEA